MALGRDTLRFCLSLSSSLLFACSASPAAASPPIDGRDGREKSSNPPYWREAAQGLEVALPDLRLELDPENLVLAWPIGWSFPIHDTARSAYHAGGDGGPGIWLELGGEPQLEIRDGNWRALAFGRLHLWPSESVAIGASGGYLFGQDGSGPMTGGGIGLGAPWGGVIWLNSRYTWLPGEDRIDLGLDVRFYFWEAVVHSARRASHGSP